METRRALALEPDFENSEALIVDPSDDTVIGVIQLPALSRCAGLIQVGISSPERLKEYDPEAWSRIIRDGKRMILK